MIQKISFSFGFILFFYVAATPLHAQVVINEFSSGSSDDWVELFNTSTASANLNGLTIKDADSYEKDLAGEISGRGFTTIELSNRLNNDGDIVKLFKTGETNSVDQVAYGNKGGICAATNSQSIGRSSDGAGNTVLFSTGSKNSSNNSAVQANCPAPTPTPNPTASPNPTPSPSPTPKSSASATPKASPKKSSPSPLLEESEEATEESVLGETTEVSPSPDVSPSSEASGSGRLRGAMGILSILIGLTFSGTAGFLAFKKMNQPTS